MDENVGNMNRKQADLNRTTSPSPIFVIDTNNSNNQEGSSNSSTTIVDSLRGFIMGRDSTANSPTNQLLEVKSNGGSNNNRSRKFGHLNPEIMGSSSEHSESEFDPTFSGSSGSGILTGSQGFDNNDQCVSPSFSSSPTTTTLNIRSPSATSSSIGASVATTTCCCGSVGGSGGGGGGGSDEELYEDEMEDSMNNDFPDLTKRSAISNSVADIQPRREIPFRSASFSQVDITSEGKYIRNPKSPITLKPTAFCLLNSKSSANNNPSPLANINSTTTANNITGINPQSQQPIVESSQQEMQEAINDTHNDHEQQEQNQRTPNNTPAQSAENLSEEGSNNNDKPPDYNVIANNDSSILYPLISNRNNNGSNDFNQVENSKLSSTVPQPQHNNNPINNTDYESKSCDNTDRSVCFTLGGDDEPLKLPETSRAFIERHGKPQINDEEDTNIDLSTSLSHNNETDANMTVTEGAVKEYKDENNESSNTNESFSTPGTNSPNTTSTPPIAPPRRRYELEKSHLFRQSSAQSDGSSADEPLPVTSLSDQSCSSPCPAGSQDQLLLDDLVNVTTQSASSSSESESSRSGGGGNNTSSKIPVKGTMSAPLFEQSNNNKSRGSNNSESVIPAAVSNSGSNRNSYSSSVFDNHTISLYNRNISRAQSVIDTKLIENSEANTRSLPRGRYSKRPLRGPYGQMLEELMLFKQRDKELGNSIGSASNLEFYRESKSSSPVRSTDSLSSRSGVVPNIPGSPVSPNKNPGNGSDIKNSVVGEVVVTGGNNSKHLLSTNSLIMTSMDDLTLAKTTKHSVRNRKTSTNLPVQNSRFPESGLPGPFHQRTASSPSQLLSTTTTLSSVNVRNPDLPSSSHHTGPIKRILDASPRGHVLAEIVETEKSYVDSLRILVKKYMEPLKTSDFIDANLVDEIFFQIPNILWHHERLLDALQKRVIDDKQCVGDVLLEAFRQDSLLECYSLFVNNWKNAKGSLKMAIASKPSLTRFLDANARQHKGKLNLDSLLIMPIQRIPRFELLVKTYDLTGLNSTGTPFSGTSSSAHEDDDMKTLQRMMELANTLKCPHNALDEVLKELLSPLKPNFDSSGHPIELEIKSSDGSDCPDLLKIYFGSIDKKIGWVESLQDTIGKFLRYGFGKLPQVQFLQALPIRKTRAGLQLSCAAPVSLYNKVSKTLEMSDVWVANSDGYVGQICILTLQPEPSITSCNGVCNSRITCMISVPPPSHNLYHHSGTTSPNIISTTASTVPAVLSLTSISAGVLPHQHSLHHHHHHPHHHDEHPTSPYHHHHVHSMGYESEDETHKLRTSLLQTPKSTEHWSVWLGTEDGGLHVYDCSDSVRVKKNRHKVQHRAPLNCIVYYENRVFVALGNGDVAVYNRNSNGKGWSIGDPSWVTIGSSMTPITKMTCVGSNVWCACGSQIKVYSESGGLLELLQSVQITTEGNQIAKGITTMVATEDHVWVAVQGSSIVKCYNQSNYEIVCEANVAPEVAKILAGVDDIIRQHKSACLRVTALLVAPDKTLWVGTSAGVILTLMATNNDENLKIVPLNHGHTGQVRFLTCCTSKDHCTVISGGDGYEEFRPVVSLLNNNSNSFASMVTSFMGDSSIDISGREDSTNHLLIWKTPKQAA